MPFGVFSHVSLQDKWRRKSDIQPSFFSCVFPLLSQEPGCKQLLRARGLLHDHLWLYGLLKAEAMMDAGARSLGLGILVKAGEMGLAYGYEHCPGSTEGALLSTHTREGHR